MDNEDILPERPASLGAMHPIRAHASFIWVFVLSATLSALGYTYAYSERFAAETTTLFQPAEVTRLSPQDTRALGSPVPNTPFKVIGQTFDGLVKSDSMLRETVRELNLDAPETVVYDGPWYKDYYKWVKQYVQEYGAEAWSYLQFGRIVPANRTSRAIADLRKHTKVLSEDSYVFTLRTLALSPEAAAKTANLLAEKLVALTNGEDRRSALRRAQELRKLSEGKVEEIAGLEAKLRELLNSADAASFDSEIEQATSRKSQLQLQLMDAQASLHQETSRATGYADRLRAGQEESRAASYSDRLRGRIAMPLAVGDETSGATASRLSADDYSHMTSDRLAAENRALGMQARAGFLRHELAPLDERLQQLNNLRSDYDIVSAQLQGAKRDLVALSDATQESVIQASNLQPQLRVESEAQVPSSPVSPIKIYHVGLAAILAWVLGMGMAVLLGYFDIHLLVVGEKWRMPAPVSLRPRLPADLADAS